MSEQPTLDRQVGKKGVTTLPKRRRARSLAALLLAPVLLLQVMAAGQLPLFGQASSGGPASLVICSASGGTRTIALDQGQEREKAPGRGAGHSCCVGLCQLACGQAAAILAAGLGPAFPPQSLGPVAYAGSLPPTPVRAASLLPDVRAPPFSL